jgi:hypothetical protein
MIYIYKLVDNPHENYSYLRTINHSEIGVICTNIIAIQRGPLILFSNDTHDPRKKQHENTPSKR